MAITPRTPSRPGRRFSNHALRDQGASVEWTFPIGRVVSNFAILGTAEVVCRGLSVVLTLSLARRLGSSGFGKIEFAFNMVFWLVLVVRDCFETIITREVARHPRLTRTLVNHVLAVKLALASALLIALSVTSVLAFTEPIDRWVVILYGLLLLTTALGLDFVFRGRETMGVVAISLLVRTLTYCAGVCYWVHDPTRILLVPVWLATGEVAGIGLVWVAYSRKFGLPRPRLGVRFLRVLVKRGRSVGLIHLCQSVILSADLLVVGLMSPWADVGRYGAPHRMISAVMAFGMILQQVVFPALSKSWRSSGDGRALLDFAVRVLVSGFMPVAVGGALLAEPLVRFLLPGEYHHAGVLLAMGIWKVPLLSLAFLYQSALVAMNRESQGLRLILWGSVGSAPLIAMFHWGLGLPGASLAVLLISMSLAAAGYYLLSFDSCKPPAHHHIGRPLFASALMVPVCLLALRVHLACAILAGAVSYLVTMKMIGGLDFGDDWGRVTRPPIGASRVDLPA